MVSLNEQADTSFAVEDKGFLCGEIETCSSNMRKIAAADDLLNFRFQKAINFASTLFVKFIYVANSSPFMVIFHGNSRAADVVHDEMLFINENSQIHFDADFVFVVAVVNLRPMFQYPMINTSMSMFCPMPKDFNAIRKLTELLRLPLLPAFPEASNSRERMAHGVNFAAAAAGILDDTCRNCASLAISMKSMMIR
ncbi:hypothetical protein Tco_1270533 [Tanacetum coccineum]